MPARIATSAACMTNQILPAAARLLKLSSAIAVCSRFQATTCPNTIRPKISRAPATKRMIAPPEGAARLSGTAVLAVELVSDVMPASYLGRHLEDFGDFFEDPLAF